MKVKEPIEAEYGLLREDQIIFTYFHFASSEPLTHACIKSKAVCLAYETVESDRRYHYSSRGVRWRGGCLFNKAQNIWRTTQGKGGGVPGVEPGRVLILAVEL